MQDYQREFIELAIRNNVLRFGEFKLKSGRISPYFFNAALFCSGADLSDLGRLYAAAIAESGIDFDMVFGPAYKGIPLSTVAAVKLHDCHGISKPWSCNRKEAKDHGEGGTIIGSKLQGKVLVIDDVITAGTAIRESMGIISGAGAELAGVAVALDRMERGQGELSAIQEIKKEYGISVISIITLNDLIEFLRTNSDFKEHLPAVEAYREQYGVKA